MATYKLLDEEPATKQAGRYVLLDEKEPAPSVASIFKDEVMTSLPGGVVRGVKDVIDTGAGWLSRLGGSEEAARVKAMNEQGKADFAGAQERTGNTVVPAIGRVGGQVLATAPVTALGGAAATAAGLPRLGAAIASGGMTTGRAVAPGLAAKAADLGIRSAGGAIAGGASAGLVNPEDAGTGALVGGALPIAGQVLKGAASIGRKALGATTGVGEEAISQAYKSGQQGGASGKSFREAMRGESNMDDVLIAAKQNLENMGKQRQAAYRQGMAGVKADKTVLDFKGIDKALSDASDSVAYKGVVKSPGAADKLKQAAEEVKNWKSLDPAEYHTPEGLDALKQRVGDILESIPYNEQNARRVVGNVYNSIKSEISKQAPEYSKAMKGYSEASETIKEIERSLSLGQKSTAESGIRKLQSLMRNNVNTSYGKRGELAKTLEMAGGNQMLPAIAGQSLNDWLPRGIQRAATGTGGAGLALTGNIPAAAGLAAISSPRLVGEGAYAAGRLSNTELAKLLRQGAYYSAPVSAAD
jgi:hypothetical protein